MSEQVVVGRIGRAHGLRGEVAVTVHTDDPELRFAPGTAIDTEPVAAGPLTVVATRWHAGRLLVAFAGVTDRDTAETLRGTLLVVPGDCLPPLDDPDEYWDRQLVGLAAVDRGGGSLGTVEDVIHLPGGDLLSVRRDAGELLVPFVRAIVPHVDLAGGRVVVDPPAGLLDL